MDSSSVGGTRGVVAVVGATGRQGSAVVRHLLQDGWQVRALTRNPSSAASLALRESGASIQRADAEDISSLLPAFADAHGVFNVQNPMTSSADAEVRQGRNVAEAAAQSGVQHVVYGAAGVGDVETGVGSWDSKLVIAQGFHERGLPLTVLRPMAFMELMTDKKYYPQLSTWQVMPKLMGPSRPVGWLCLDDLGAITARVFAAPERWGGTVLSLAADVQSIDQCRNIWAERTGRKPHGFPIPVPLFERFVGTDLTTMWRWLRANRFDISTQQTREILPDAFTVRQWVDRTLAG
ncbi:NmrA/HSCARG family protein [Pseudarthrobacter sp. J75]|uniref:NmrA/HSCARG family protein n=1 Tax=unclassified Pseudarthrobacter TaxID=2647000 RepID=UPI002E80B195|nr:MULTISPECIES: NmrA/HSCARG family protein [unclassified Pseudarthrobacter]MEE2522437.1 NmrA/HSCARG family protein [Pseudarthrobacter sp. J47]MEE2529232.1 NmrA/HSCARG family protein [Pseudarthrobacter sp. J75]MEE2570510.1 NmrA/HSCARG family protein [Pseudarthrobacter sp. J64]